MLAQVNVNVAKQYSTHPLGRERDLWPFGGQRFREDFVQSHLMAGKTVCVDLRGTKGLAPSFLEEAFGGLVEAGFSYETLRRQLDVIADDAARERQIWRYIKTAAGLPV